MSKHGGIGLHVETTGRPRPTGGPTGDGGGVAAGGGAGGGGPDSAAGPTTAATDIPTSATTAAAPAKDVQWADAHLGRGAALAANGVYGAAAGTTKLVGWTIGDPSLHVRSGLRSLGAMHLRVSARVHHVAFYHPSLDAEIAAPSSSSSSSERSSGGGGVGKAVIGGMRQIVGLDGKDAVEWAAEDAARLAAVVESESNRLSRDGIVEHHFARYRSSSGNSRKMVRAAPLPSSSAAAAAAPATKAGETKQSHSAPADARAGTGTATTNARKFVFASRIPQSAETKRSAAEQPEAMLRQVLKRKSTQSGDGFAAAASAANRTGNGSGSGNGGGTASSGKMAHTASVIFDEDGITGDGPALASLIKATPSAKIGRYLPQVACRVPSSSVCFELRGGEGRHVQSTQPFVVEAPHVIWGGGRDRMIRRAAADGNPLVNARTFEYLPNNELSLSERTESLLCAGATVWVDVAQAPKKNTKSAVDVAKGVAKGVEKAATMTAHATTKTAHATTKAAHATTKGVKKAFRLPVSPPLRPRKKDGPEKEEAAAKGSRDDDGGDNNSEERPALERSPHGKIHLDTNNSSTHESPIPDLENAEEDKKPSKEVSVTNAESIPKLPAAPSPYVLVLDDVLDFRVVGFPSSDAIASFPISVASILNNRAMEERLNNPRRPSELTITLVQEPSIKEKRWGVEAKITFRVVEVQPDTPLAVEQPEQDDKGGWIKSSKMKRMRVHLRNVGRPKEEIENEIKAMEEREAAEEEEREAAIIAAGIGKGYEQGAPAKEIVRRQMFYDPERELFRRKPRTYASGDLNSSIIRQVALNSSAPGGNKGSTQLLRGLTDVKVPSEVLALDMEGADGKEAIIKSPVDPQPERTKAYASCVGYDARPPMSIQAMRETFMSAKDLAVAFNDEGDHGDDGDDRSAGELFLSPNMDAEVGEATEDQVGCEDKDENYSAKSHSEEFASAIAAGASSVRFAESSSRVPDYEAGDKYNTREVEVDSSVKGSHGAIGLGDDTSSSRTTFHDSKGQVDMKELASSEPSRSSTISEPANRIMASSRRTEGENFFDESVTDIVEPPSPTRLSRGALSGVGGESKSLEEEEVRNKRRERKRLSVQSMALMHLSLGGVKGLVGGDELDMLYRMTIEDNEDGDEATTHASSDEADAVEKKNVPGKDAAVAIKKMGSVSKINEVLLEEYPGLLVLLCVMVVIVAVRLVVA